MAAEDPKVPLREFVARTWRFLDRTVADGKDAPETYGVGPTEAAARKAAEAELLSLFEESGDPPWSDPDDPSEIDTPADIPKYVARSAPVEVTVRFEAADQEAARLRARATLASLLDSRSIEDDSYELAPAPVALCIGDCLDHATESRPSLVRHVDEDGLCLSCGGDVVVVGLGDAEAIVRTAQRLVRRVEAADPDPVLPSIDPAADARVEALIRSLGGERADRAAAAIVTANATPWPLWDVLAKLADTADHVLAEHDCDCEGYEDFIAARDAARAMLVHRAPFACTCGAAAQGRARHGHDAGCPAGKGA